MDLMSGDLKKKPHAANFVPASIHDSVEDRIALVGERLVSLSTASKLEFSPCPRVSGAFFIMLRAMSAWGSKSRDSG
jgi:hypothetical protein